MADGSAYLKCDECGDVLDRRPASDFGGRKRDTVARGVFAFGEAGELIDYAKALGWSVNGDRHICPKHATP
jgi:hypothetical protein